MSDIAIRAARFADLDPLTLYALLRLRVDVFVVEQDCPYSELDGRDTEPDTLHLWASYPHHTSLDHRDLGKRDLGERKLGTGPALGCLRVLVEPDGSTQIGRVCVASDARGSGVAGQLMAHALEHVGNRTCWLKAQSHLTGFYARHGFSVSGPEFDEDGIPHTPMTRSC